MIGDPRAIDPLLNALNDPESRVRLNVELALKKIYESSLNSINDRLKDFTDNNHTD